MDRYDDNLLDWQVRQAEACYMQALFHHRDVVRAARRQKVLVAIAVSAVMALAIAMVLAFWMQAGVL